MELLRTGRLLLRHWDESDVEAFFDVYSREEVARWLGAHPRKPVTTVAEAQERLGRWREHERGLSPPLGLWAIVPYAAGAAPGALGQPAGTLLLLPLSDDDGPTGLVEVGWHLHPEFQGRGLEPRRHAPSSPWPGTPGSTRCWRSPTWTTSPRSGWPNVWAWPTRARPIAGSARRCASTARP